MATMRWLRRLYHDYDEYKEHDRDDNDNYHLDDYNFNEYDLDDYNRDDYDGHNTSHTLQRRLFTFQTSALSRVDFEMVL